MRLARARGGRSSPGFTPVRPQFRVARDADGRLLREMKTSAVVLFLFAALRPLIAGESQTVPARTRIAGEQGIEVRITPQEWEPGKTALIVCDFWDSHH